MNIRIADGQQELDVIKSKDFLTELSEVVFSICKNDSLFENKTSDIKQIDQMLKELKTKIRKQNTLIEKADHMQRSFNDKNKLLSNENTDTRSQLLEMLGSEL